MYLFVHCHQVVDLVVLVTDKGVRGMLRVEVMMLVRMVEGMMTWEIINNQKREKSTQKQPQVSLQCTLFVVAWQPKF